MDTQKYTIKITGPGLALEREIKKEIGDQIILIVLRGEMNAEQVSLTGPTTDVRPPSGHKPQAAVTPLGSHKLSVREFFTQCGPKTLPEKIAAIAKFLKEQEGQDSFGRSDVERCFESAAESLPGNLPRDMSVTVKIGWIAPKNGAKGMYYITHTGNQAVEGNFPPELIKRPRQATLAKKLARKTAKKE